MDESIYLHGTAPEEQNRLSLLNDLLNESAIQMMDLKGGERILDIGSGLGQFTRAMARAAGRTVVGVERSNEQITEARARAAQERQVDLLDLRQGNATSLPLRKDEWGSFDVVHTRFLLEHVPDPLSVVRMMVEAARAGGRIILQDDDHDVLRISPEPQGFYELWAAYQKTYEDVGNDPQIGRRLVQLLQQSGATPVRNHWLFFASCAGHPHFQLYVRNLLGVIDSGKEAIFATKLLDQSKYDKSIQAVEAWSKRQDAALWYAVCWAEGTKKA